MPVSIVIPTCHREEAIQRTLVSLGQNLSIKDNHEIVVVSNGREDRSPEVVAKVQGWFPQLNLRHVHDATAGLLAGRHRGARETCGDVISFIDDDIEVTPTWLTSIIGAFRDPSVDLVGGPCLPLYFELPPSWLPAFYSLYDNGKWMCTSLSLIDWGGNECDVDPTYVFGLNFSIRRDSFQRLGGFHPDCLPPELQRYQGDGETGLSAKLMETGGRARYLPGAKVLHQVPSQRMTVEYFQKRAFYQGVCDSYTKIRKNGRIVPPELPILSEAVRTSLPKRIRRMGGAVKRWVKRQIRGNEKLTSLDSEVKALVERSYREGFDFHQQEVRKDPALLEWVCRPDYFDMWLP
jgi:glucosyl-dolichyl phosphate glucuronosyltransferase